ncbi:MAG: TonB-dependent receptor, partial [Bacteroidales bacterium]|nr:TonB-dependent receptor [Bacteroidales bacterium]
LFNKFTFRRFSLGIAVQAAAGMEVFNYVRYKNEGMSNLDNQSTSVLSRWQYEGHETSIPRAVWEDPVGNSTFSTRWIEDGSYLRIRNITLSYKIPEKILAFRNLEIYISANNLFTFSNYLGYDPEFAYSHSRIHMGSDYGQMPIPRQFMAGIKIGL